MKFYALRNIEIAGGLGPGTLIDPTPILRSLAGPIPNVTKLEYRFQDWQGDAIVEAYPCYLVIEAVALALQESALTGANFGIVNVTIDNQFAMLRKMHGESADLPVFKWLKLHGSVELMGNIVTSWSGDDICFGMRTDWVKPRMIPEEMMRSLPPHELVISDRALGIFSQFQLNECEIIELSTRLAA